MNIHKLNQKKLLVKGKIIIGLDLAKTKHVGIPMLPDGVISGKPFSFGQNQESFAELWVRSQELIRNHGASGVVFAMEATGSFWEPLARHFEKKEVDLVFVHGRVVKKCREMMDLSKSKNDPKDAYLIAQLCSEGKFSEIRQPNGVWSNLRNLGLLRADLMRDWVAWGNRIRSIQDKYWPEREQVLKGCLRNTSLYLFERCPFPQDVVKLGRIGLLQLVLEGSNKRRGSKVADQLLESAAKSVGVREGTDSARWELQLAAATVKSLSERLKEVDEKLVQLASKTGYLEAMVSMPGLSAVGAALLLGEVGDPARYRNAKEWTKLAGLNLVENQSGKTKREGKRISRIGRPVLRHVLYYLCIPVLRHNADFRVSYLELRKRGKPTMKAIIASMCRLLRVCFALCRSKQPYQLRSDSEAKLAQLREEHALKKAS